MIEFPESEHKESLGNLVKINGDPGGVEGGVLRTGDEICFGLHRFRLEMPHGDDALPGSPSLQMSTVSEPTETSTQGSLLPRQHEVSEKELEVQAWEQRLQELRSEHEAGARAVAHLKQEEDAKRKELERLSEEAVNQTKTLAEVTQPPDPTP